MNKINIKRCNLIILFILIIIYQFLFIGNINVLKSNNLNEEYIKIENYLKICRSSTNLNIMYKKESIEPKISIITPVYNTGKYVLTLLRSIQHQNFNNIEIILIDDYSKDHSVELIKKYQQIDKRIKLIKNKKNKGTFACRNIGILNSRGKYIMLPDSDDIILENTLGFFYQLAIKYKYEIIRFNAYTHYGHTFFGSITNKLRSKPIFQPELSTYIFYGLGYLEQVDYNTWNKFINREALIKSLNSLNKEEIYMYMTCHEDGLLNYMLYRYSKSCYFIKKFGYYYIRNRKKRRSYYNYKNIKFSFIHIMNVFKFSKNNKYEKDMTKEIFKRLIYKKQIIRRLSLIKKEYNFFIDIINNLNENEFFSIKYKKYLSHFKKYFKKHIHKKYKLLIN